MKINCARHEFGVTCILCRGLWSCVELAGSSPLSRSALRILQLEDIFHFLWSFSESGNQLPEEIRDILDDPAPHHVPLPERGFVNPGAARVDDIVFDTRRADSFASPHDACRNGDPAAVADRANDFALRIHLAHKLEHSLAAP